MKRTNLVLDETLLEEAKRELGARTYSATVNLALAELLRVRRVQRLPQYFGSMLWRGDLSEMRDDRAPAPSRRGARRLGLQSGDPGGYVGMD